jgi:hypothetical protein
MNEATIPVPLRTKLAWVSAAYGVVLTVSVLLVVWRYLQYRWHAEDANLYSGMWAGGDMALGVFIFCLFLVPTFVLVLIIRNSETLYTRYAKVLLGLGLSAPLSLGLVAIPAVNQGQSLLGWIFFWRILGSPFVFLVLAGSRLLARFPRSKRLCSYAVLIEGLTLVAMVGLGLGTKLGTKRILFYGERPLRPFEKLSVPGLRRRFASKTVQPENHRARLGLAPTTESSPRTLALPPGSYSGSWDLM